MVVLAEDGMRVRPFADEWTNRMVFYSSYEDAKKMATGQQNAFAFLADYAENVYLNVFRHHSGVETYFAILNQKILGQINKYNSRRRVLCHHLGREKLEFYVLPQF